MPNLQPKRRVTATEASSGTKTGRIILPSMWNDRNDKFLAILDEEGYWRLGNGGWLIHVHPFYNKKGVLDGFEGKFRQYTQDMVISAAEPCSCTIPQEIKRKYDFLYNMMRSDKGWW